MNTKITLVIGLLALASTSFATWLSTTEDIKTRNADFEDGLANGHFPAALVQAVDEFATNLGQSVKDIPTGCLRLWMEGLYIALVANDLHPTQPRRKTLFLSGYGGNGATVFNIVKARVAGGESCTLVLLPSFDGSRGNNGIYGGYVHQAYDALEADFRKCNDSLEESEQVKIITITDMGDIEDWEIPEAFANIAKLQNDIKHLERENNARRRSFNCLNDRDCKPLHDKLQKYYERGHSLHTQLTNKIQNLLKTRLDSLKMTEYDICFEGYLGQGFDPTLSAVANPVLDFLADVQMVSTMVSVDYPVGWTDEGFQTTPEQYRPHTMIVIFLKKSILEKDGDGNFHLGGVQIVQMDWNTVVSASGHRVRDTYGVPPVTLVKEETVHDAITHRALIGMTTDDDKAKWDKISSAENKPAKPHDFSYIDDHYGV